MQRFVQCPDGENQMLYKPVPKCCASFTRRYSEFLAVYSALMESHRSLMEEFEGFPKKVLIGKCILCWLFILKNLLKLSVGLKVNVLNLQNFSPFDKLFS